MIFAPMAAYPVTSPLKKRLVRVLLKIQNGFMTEVGIRLMSRAKFI